MEREEIVNNIVFVAVLAICAEFALAGYNERWAGSDFSYFIYSPMRYRLWTQFLLFFNGRPLSLAALFSMSFVASMLVLWLIVRRTNELGVLLLGIVTVCLFLRLADAPMYVLLACVAKTKRPELLVPLILVKEAAAWLAFGYLLLYCRTRKTVFYGCVAGLLYLVVRFIIIGNVPSFYPGYPLVILPLVIEELSAMSITSLLFNVGAAFALVVCVIQDRKQLFLAIWLLIPILLFSVAYEVHHWFMLVVLLVSHRCFLGNSLENYVEVGKT